MLPFVHLDADGAYMINFEGILVTKNATYIHCELSRLELLAGLISFTFYHVYTHLFTL